MGLRTGTEPVPRPPCPHLLHVDGDVEGVQDLVDGARCEDEALCHTREGWGASLHRLTSQALTHERPSSRGERESRSAGREGPGQREHPRSEEDRDGGAVRGQGDGSRAGEARHSSTRNLMPQDDASASHPARPDAAPPEPACAVLDLDRDHEYPRVPVGNAVEAPP